MYKLVNPNDTYSDFENCLTQGYFRKSNIENKNTANSPKQRFGIEIAPNPTNHEAIVNYTKAGKNDMLQISDLSGKIIAKYQLLEASTTINLNTENLNNGIYFLHHISTSLVVKIRKFVVFK